MRTGRWSAHRKARGQPVWALEERADQAGDQLRVRKNDSAVIAVALEASRVRTVPSWLAFNEDEKSGKVLALPERDEMDAGVEEHLIVEFYSR